MFHVKHFHEMNEEILLAYTEILEDGVQNVFNVDTAEQPTQGMRGRPQFFRSQLIALAPHR